MRIRPATTRDLHRITEITTTSLQDDPTFDYMWPRHREYPEDNFFFWQMRLQKLLYDKKTVFLVAVLTAEDEPSTGDKQDEGRTVKETIVAYGIWERLGHSRRARKVWACKKTLINLVDNISTSLQQWSLDKKYVRRDADFKRLDALSEASKAIGKKYWSDVKELWLLELLVTDRPYRRRGAGTMLVKQGTDMADLEGIPCRVEASPMGRLLYTSCNFQELGKEIIKVKDDPEELAMWCMGRQPGVVGETPHKLLSPATSCSSIATL